MVTVTIHGDSTVEIVAAIAQVGLVLAAMAAGSLAWLDLRRARLQHRELLAAGLRPLLLADPSAAVVEPESMRLVIKNVGVGPALSLNGRAGIALVPEGREPTIAVANELIERVTAGIRGTVAHFELQASGLQAGASTANWIPSAPQRPSLKPGDRVAVVYEIDYENVFEDPFQVEATLGDRVISG